MSKRFSLWAAFLAATVLGTWSCSDDSSSKSDSQVSQADQGAQDGAVDGGSLVDQRLPPDFGMLPNSGILCSTAEECAMDDECISPPGGNPLHRMCLSGCSPGKVCDVPDPVHNASQCVIRIQDSTTGNIMHLCAWFCEYQGKTYDCPNAEDYNCVDPPGVDPGIKICVPK